MIRHAPAQTEGRLCGRTDIPATRHGLTRTERLAAILLPAARRWSSPALRCRQTAAALWPEEAIETDPRLWEQDFGEWDGLPLANVPDLGAFSADALAQHRPPGGESFADLCARVHPALTALAERSERVAIVTHAGTIRAALALALDSPARALAFEVAPLSVTRLRLVPGGFAVTCVNCPA